MPWLHKAYLALRCIPKTLIFNFRYFRIKDAIRFPVIVSHRVAFDRLSGTVTLGRHAHFNTIRIGFHENPQFDQRNNRAVWSNDGSVYFEGIAYLGNGTAIANEGELRFGNNVQFSGNSSIICKSSISFGDDCLIAWGCTFIDGDAHDIRSLADGKKLNDDASIDVGERVWFAMNCTVLKGCSIGKDCVIAANTLLTKSIDTNNVIIGGNPARPLKENIQWSA